MSLLYLLMIPMFFIRAINKQFKVMRNYCAINKLSINFQNTHYMVISLTKKKLQEMKITSIEQKGFIKYLGIFWMSILIGTIKTRY